MGTEVLLGGGVVEVYFGGGVRQPLPRSELPNDYEW